MYFFRKFNLFLEKYKKKIFFKTHQNEENRGSTPHLNKNSFSTGHRSQSANLQDDDEDDSRRYRTLRAVRTKRLNMSPVEKGFYTGWGSATPQRIPSSPRIFSFPHSSRFYLEDHSYAFFRFPFPFFLLLYPETWFFFVLNSNDGIWHII